MRERPMEMVEDNLMEAWINSASKEDAFWLIQQKVPVFIIHKITEMELFLCNDMRRLPGFVTGSEAEALMPAYNYLDRKAESWGKLRPLLLTDERILTPNHLCWDMLDPKKFHYSLSQGDPAKLIPLFLSADSEDEDEGEVKFLSNHENDLFPTILQQKAMAEAKSAQEDLQPKDIIPLPKPSVGKPLGLELTPSQGIAPPPPLPNLDAAEAHRILQVNSEEVPLAEGRMQVKDVTAKENEKSTLNAALVCLSSSDQTKLSLIKVDNTFPITSLPRIQAATDDMDIDPEDNVLDYRMLDNETLPVNATSCESPVVKVITTDKDPSLSTSLEQGGTSHLDKEMPLAEEQPNPVSDLVTRQEAGSLGVIDLVASRHPTEFLVVTGAPIKEVTWADYLATMAHLIEDGSLYEGQFIQVPSLADCLGGASSSTLENEDVTDLDIDKEEDMEELPGNKHHLWKACGKRAGKKHCKMYLGEFLLKAPP
ncbi:hypothetical protein DXG01_014659 [Tephrocybe rancida]|nr:hypothetical protein DXG01_014659 [Tephrocybe rancida]